MDVTIGEGSAMRIALSIPIDSLHYGVTKTAVLGLLRGSSVMLNAMLPGETT